MDAYDLYLIEWWYLYHYHDHDYSVLPLAKDGHLSYGLLKSMMALDDFYVAGKEYKEGNKQTKGQGEMQSI